MKFMVSFTWQPDTDKRSEAISRFTKLGAEPPAGAKFVGRLTRADLSGGFTLLETSDAQALADFAYQWSDLMDLEIFPVLEDDGLARVFETAAPMAASTRR